MNHTVRLFNWPIYWINMLRNPEMLLKPFELALCDTYFDSFSCVSPHIRSHLQWNKSVSAFRHLQKVVYDFKSKNPVSKGTKLGLSLVLNRYSVEEARLVVFEMVFYNNLSSEEYWIQKSRHWATWVSLKRVPVFVLSEITRALLFCCWLEHLFLNTKPTSCDFECQAQQKSKQSPFDCSKDDQCNFNCSTISIIYRKNKSLCYVAQLIWSLVCLGLKTKTKNKSNPAGWIDLLDLNKHHNLFCVASLRNQLFTIITLMFLSQLI